MSLLSIPCKRTSSSMAQPIDHSSGLRVVLAKFPRQRRTHLHITSTSTRGALQKKLVWFLWEEWDIHINQATVSRLMKRRRWSSQAASRISNEQNNELRVQWAAECLHLRAEQLVFVNETLFNESTGWRHRVYAPIGRPARYHTNLRRGHCWSVLPAYTVDGYLP